MNPWQNLFYPERYHGHGRRPPFFEGWYFKLVDAAEQNRLAIIPAIFKNSDPTKHHSFIQVLDGLTGEASYHRYPAEAFSSPADRFALQIDRNCFDSHQLILDIADEQRTLRGSVQLGALSPWPVSPLSPGIMGPFGWVPLMECNHGVVSFDHPLSGTLTLDGRPIDFTGGRGYIEKDWGAAFPAGYVWMQTNHFEQPAAGTSFIGSIAIIPWLGNPFAGFICGLWHNGRLYRFATYTGAKTTHLAITDQTVSWTMRSRQHQINIEATRAQGGLLYGPNRENMAERVGETMLATVHIRLSERHDGRLTPIFEGTGRCAGLEIHGDTERLLQLQKET